MSGYYIVIDADGAEVPGSRRNGTGDRQRNLAIRKELMQSLGPDCIVIWRDNDGPTTNILM